MRFARRAEGIKAARTVFKKARDDTRTKGHVMVCKVLFTFLLIICCGQVYVAAALMEYYCTKVTKEIISTINCTNLPYNNKLLRKNRLC